MKQAIVALVLVTLGSVASAQPSDAQIRKDLGGNGIISIKLGKSRGTVQLNTDTKNYEYVRGAEILRTTEWPGIKLIVTGDAVYQRTGRGFQYWKFRVADNRYLGIPNPTAAEIDAVLVTNPTDVFGGGLASTIVKVHQPPKLLADPKWNWHTPMSVSFLMEGKIDRVASYTEVETIAQQIEVRLYRDDLKAPWKSFMVTPRERTSLGKTKYTAAEIRTMPNLIQQASEVVAKARAAKLPSVTIPAFATHTELAHHLHALLRTGPREQAEATLRALIAPRHFAPGSTTLLGARAEQMLERALDRAFGDKVSYAQQYCAKAATETRGSRDRVYFIGVRPNIITEYVIVKADGQYRDGVKVGERWVLDDLAVRTVEDADTLAWIASFSDRRKLCPND